MTIKETQVVKVQDFRGVTIDGLKHILSLCLKKTERIILHIGMNDAVSKISR